MDQTLILAEAKPIEYLNDSLVTEVVVPEHITALSDFAFEYCDSLHSVTLPAGLNSIGSAFICCYNLNHIECRAVVPPVVDTMRLDRQLHIVSPGPLYSRQMYLVSIQCYPKR